LGFFGGLGDFPGSKILEVHGLDDTDSHCLPHVTYGETPQGREISESLNAHGLGGNKGDDGSITRLDGLQINMLKI